MRIICRQITVLWLFILCKQCTYCIIVSTLQFAVLMLQLTTLTGLTCFFLSLTICQVLNFVFLHRHKNSYLLFHSCFSLILFIFLVFQLTIILFGVNITDVNFFSMCIQTMCRGVAKNGGTRGEISWWHPLPTKK